MNHVTQVTVVWQDFVMLTETLAVLKAARQWRLDRLIFSFVVFSIKPYLGNNE